MPSKPSVAKPDSTRTDDQTALALFWDGNASIHWNQAANQMARAHHLSMSDANPLLGGPEYRHGRHRVHDMERQAILRRRSERSDLEAGDLDPAGGYGRQSGMVPDPAWLPLINTPAHPEYPAGHPSQNGAAATVLLSHFGRPQTFTLTTIGQPSRDVHQHCGGALGREQRPSLGRLALSEHRRDQRCRGRGDRQLRESELHAPAPRQALKVCRHRLALLLPATADRARSDCSGSNRSSSPG